MIQRRSLLSRLAYAPGLCLQHYVVFRQAGMGRFTSLRCACAFTWLVVTG